MDGDLPNVLRRPRFHQLLPMAGLMCSLRHQPDLWGQVTMCWKGHAWGCLAWKGQALGKGQVVSRPLYDNSWPLAPRTNPL